MNRADLTEVAALAATVRARRPVSIVVEVAVRRPLRHRLEAILRHQAVEVFSGRRDPRLRPLRLREVPRRF